MSCTVAVYPNSYIITTINPTPTTTALNFSHPVVAQALSTYFDLAALPTLTGIQQANFNSLTKQLAITPQNINAVISAIKQYAKHN